MKTSPELFSPAPRQSAQRGAARVSAVWLIVLLVLLGVSSAFIYIANQGTTRAEESLAKVTAERNEAQSLIDVEVNKTVEISKLLGFRDLADPLSTSNATAFQDALTALKQVFPDIASAKSFEEVVQPVATAYRTVQQKLANAEGEAKGLQGQIQAKDAAARQTEADLQKKIRDLETAKADLEQNTSEQIADLERRLAEVTNKYTQASDALTDEKARYAELERSAERSSLAATTRMLTINSQLDKLRYQSEQPDGEVLTISTELGLGWINRGTKDRVVEGMAFEVRTGNPNPSAKLTKADAEVIKAEAERSLVRFTGQRDGVDPPVQGDLLYNSLYQPGAERYAVLAGAFTGDYNEAELKMLLAEIGIQVQEHLDNSTNYLIAGNPMYVDENGEPVSEPIQPSDLAVYKDAQSKGCAIIPYSDLRKFFRR